MTTTTRPSKPLDPERVEIAYLLLADGMRKGDIKRLLRDRYGLNAWAAEPYISAARDRLADQIDVGKVDAFLEQAWEGVQLRLGATRGGMFLQSAAFWRDVLGSDAGGKDRLVALERLCRLFGLDPKQGRERFARR